MVICNPQSLDCFVASELMLRDGKLEVFEADVASGNFIYINKLISDNVTISFSFISAVIPFLPLSNLNEINMISSTLEVVQALRHPELLEESDVKALQLEDPFSPPALLPGIPQLVNWLPEITGSCLFWPG